MNGGDRNQIRRPLTPNPLLFAEDSSQEMICLNQGYRDYIDDPESNSTIWDEEKKIGSGLAN